MLWIAPKYQSILQAAAVDGYDALVSLSASRDLVEKQGRSTGRYVIRACESPLSFYLKKYYRLPWWRHWFSSINSYPGPLELANLQRAASVGVPVPEPIVAGAERWHDCLSMLAVRELVGYVPMHEFIPSLVRCRDTTQQRVMRRQLTTRLAEVARCLHAARLFHCDFYLCHFFIRPPPVGAAEPLDLLLIDWTRLRQSRLERWRIKDLAQLLFSSDLPGIWRTDRLRFFKQYLGVRRLDFEGRRLLRRIQWKAKLYHRHNESLARKAAA